MAFAGYRNGSGPGATLTTTDEQLLTPPWTLGPVAERAWVARITSELSMSFAELADIGPAVSVFGSARAQPGGEDYELARRVIRGVGAAGFAVITGAGPGIMEAANRSAQEAGALSVGLDIELPDPQPVNAYVDRLVRFQHFFVRKLAFVRYASAFIVFTGGFGTLDELFEALTLIQTGKICRFPVILAGNGEWDGLDRWLQRDLLPAGTVDAHDLALITRSDDPARIVEILSKVCT